MSLAMLYAVGSLIVLISKINLELFLTKNLFQVLSLDYKKSCLKNVAISLFMTKYEFNKTEEFSYLEANLNY